MNQTIPSTKTKPSRTNIAARRNARVLAVQTIYALEVNSFLDAAQVVVNVLESKEAFLSKLNNKKPAALDRKHYLAIVKEVEKNYIQLDAAIEPNLAEGWRVARLGIVVRAILRAASCELQILRQSDPALVIDEYLEIAKILNHEGEVGFINKVLDALIVSDQTTSPPTQNPE